MTGLTLAPPGLPEFPEVYVERGSMVTGLQGGVDHLHQQRV